MALQQLPDGGVLRASGKRFRRRYDPGEWATSLLTARHNVLCLGMSYPCVDTVLANCKGKRPPTIFHSEPSVERSVELVRRKLLTQIVGRDLARVAALEADGDISAYTVSIETGSHYVQRHLHADFNGRTFVDQMRRRWGTGVRFRQVILDYFWSPSGAWAIKSWQRSFFSENIPRFVTENLFNYGDLEKDTTFVSASEAGAAEDYFTSTAGVIYLPFCSHCLSMVVAHIDELSQFFTVSFLHKDELGEHTLWNATNTISADSMKGWLAKEIFQEEIYCRLNAQGIRNGACGASVRKEEILEVFHRIYRVHDVRMIKLMALRKFHPNFPKSRLHLEQRPILGLNTGGYVGLRNQRPAGPRNARSAPAIPTNNPPARKGAKRSKVPRKSAGRRKRASSGVSYVPGEEPHALAVWNGILRGMQTMEEGSASGCDQSKPEEQSGEIALETPEGESDGLAGAAGWVQMLSNFELGKSSSAQSTGKEESSTPLSEVCVGTDKPADESPSISCSSLSASC